MALAAAGSAWMVSISSCSLRAPMAYFRGNDDSVALMLRSAVSLPLLKISPNLDTSGESVARSILEIK